MIRLSHEFEQTPAGEIFAIKFTSEDVPGHSVHWHRTLFTVQQLAPGDHPVWPELIEHAPAFSYAQARQQARRILEDSAKGLDG